MPPTDDPRVATFHKTVTNSTHPVSLDLQSEMRLGDDEMNYARFAAPPPNWLRQLLWKWALGVTWKDLRPERAMDELQKLK